MPLLLFPTLHVHFRLNEPASFSFVSLFPQFWELLAPTRFLSYTACLFLTYQSKPFISNSLHINYISLTFECQYISVVQIPPHITTVRPYGRTAIVLLFTISHCFTTTAPADYELSIIQICLQLRNCKYEEVCERCYVRVDVELKLSIRVSYRISKVADVQD